MAVTLPTTMVCAIAVRHASDGGGGALPIAVETVSASVMIAVRPAIHGGRMSHLRETEFADESPRQLSLLGLVVLVLLDAVLAGVVLEPFLRFVRETIEVLRVQPAVLVRGSEQLEQCLR